MIFFVKLFKNNKGFNVKKNTKDLEKFFKNFKSYHFKSKSFIQMFWIVEINFFNDEGIIIMNLSQSSNADFGIHSNFDSSEISTIWIFRQWLNIFVLIFVTFDGIKISWISIYENAFVSIVCKSN